MVRGDQLFEFGRRAIWEPDASALPAWKAGLLRAVRIAYKVVQDAVEGDLALRAMSLVYTTLLSLVPLLAVSFSVLKGFGAHNQIEPILRNFLAPLGDKGAELTGNIIGFVENMKVGVLGGVGVAMLLYTVVALVRKIEQAFNRTWHTTQSRSLGERFSDYLSVIMIGPLLMFAAVGITASVMSHSIVRTLIAVEPFGILIGVVTRLLPYLLVVAAFSFVYAFVPNTKVKLRSAFVGALVAGIGWQATGVLFAAFVAGSARYTAIYSGFAIVILFMIWLYASWLILLGGASIAFYHQHPEQLVASRRTELSSRLKERLALLVSYLVGRRHLHGQPAFTLDQLAGRIGLPMDALARVVDALESRCLLLRTADDPPGYVPGRALESIRVSEVIDAVRSAEEGRELGPLRLPQERSVDHVLDGLDRAVREALGERNLRELVADPPAGSGS